MKLQERIEILGKAGEYLSEKASAPLKDLWQTAQNKAFIKNPWFTPDNIQRASRSIAENFLIKEKLQAWAAAYHVSDAVEAKKIGIVMAGNIPMVGFHDLLCAFISGHQALCKLSSKDDILIQELVERMIAWNPEVRDYIQFAERLNGCDAYIATGSDNSARYFSYYFGKYPSIIRKNRTSVAILTGHETSSELEGLADDIMSYFGLGCRNVTQIRVPRGYDFIPLLEALKKYDACFHHAKYRNNYDYQLAIYIMHNIYYMTNDVIVLVEKDQPFSPIGTVHYAYYDNETEVYQALRTHASIQAWVGHQGIAFGQTQNPSLTDYADGVDVMAFLKF